MPHKASNNSPTMDYLPRMPTTNTTPVWCHSDDDDTRKQQSVCTSTQPTPPRNERATPSNPPHSVSRSFVLPPNPYRSSHPDVFIADTSRASTPQLKQLSAISVTPGSSAKKKRGTTVHSTTKSWSNKSGNKFILSTYELYKPFRDGVLLLMDDPGVVPGPASNADAVLDADRAVNFGTHPDADVATDVDADVNVDVEAGVDADLRAQLHANQGDATPVPAPACDLEAANNDFDTKAYSLMRNHFVHTRTSTKQKSDW
eukprot:scaffold39906_cov57-Attheya_sp.AAC.5